MFYECNEDTTPPQAGSFEKYIMTLYPLEVDLQTFLSITVTQKCQFLSCDTIVANERYVRRECTPQTRDNICRITENCKCLI